MSEQEKWVLHQVPSKVKEKTNVAAEYMQQGGNTLPALDKAYDNRIVRTFQENEAYFKRKIPQRFLNDWEQKIRDQEAKLELSKEDSNVATEDMQNVKNSFSEFYKEYDCRIVQTFKENEAYFERKIPQRFLSDWKNKIQEQEKCQVLHESMEKEIGNVLPILPTLMKIEKLSTSE